MGEIAKIMSVIRAFVAIDLTQDLYTSLEKVSNDLQAALDGMPIRWVPTSKIHLTLKFLGDVSETNVAALTGILQADAANHKVFEISVGGYGVFPNMKRPRVIWVGVEAPEELGNLQRRIEAEAERLGYAPDLRKFNPHLTIARVARNADPKLVRQISEVMAAQKLGFLGAARISEVHLYRSDLQPGGTVYSKLFSAALSE